MTVRVIVVLAALTLMGCGDDHNTFLTVLPDKDTPKKCIDDPCLSGCPPHDFICEEKDE